MRKTADNLRQLIAKLKDEAAIARCTDRLKAVLLAEIAAADPSYEYSRLQ